jgi:hypothetical protein
VVQRCDKTPREDFGELSRAARGLQEEIGIPVFCRPGRPTGRSLKNALKAAFSPVELLVVIAVIGILLVLLLPTLGAAKERGRRIMCKSILNQIGLTFHMYGDENRDLLPDCTSNNPSFFGLPRPHMPLAGAALTLA